MIKIEGRKCKRFNRNGKSAISNKMEKISYLRSIKETKLGKD